MIDISGLDKHDVFEALYNRARLQGFGLAFNASVLSRPKLDDIYDEAKEKYFDYVGGRVMKVWLDKDEFDERLYDRDNGLGAAQEAIDEILAK